MNSFFTYSPQITDSTVYVVPPKVICYVYTVFVSPGVVGLPHAPRGKRKAKRRSVGPGKYAFLVYVVGANPVVTNGKIWNNKMRSDTCHFRINLVAKASKAISQSIFKIIPKNMPNICHFMGIVFIQERGQFFCVSSVIVRGKLLKSNGIVSSEDGKFSNEWNAKTYFSQNILGHLLYITYAKDLMKPSLTTSLN